MITKSILKGNSLTFHHLLGGIPNQRELVAMKMSHVIWSYCILGALVIVNRLPCSFEKKHIPKAQEVQNKKKNNQKDQPTKDTNKQTNNASHRLPDPMPRRHYDWISIPLRALLYGSLIFNTQRRLASPWMRIQSTNRGKSPKNMLHVRRPFFLNMKRDPPSLKLTGLPWKWNSSAALLAAK